MSITYGEGVGWATLLAFWTNDLGDDGVDISVSGGGTVTDLIAVSADMIANGLGVGITQRHVIGGANATLGNVATPVNFPIPVVAATMGHTVAAPAQVQQYTLLAVVPATLGGSATSSIIGMNVGSPIMGHTVVAPTQLQTFPITPVAAIHGHTVAAPGQTQLHVLPVTLAAQGHTATPVPKGLTVVPATMIHDGLAVSLVQVTPGMGVANASMDHSVAAPELFTLTQLGPQRLWLAPESGVVVSATNRITQWTGKNGTQNATNTRLSAMPYHTSAVQNGYNVVEFRGTEIDGRLFATNVAAASALAQSGASQWTLGIVCRHSGASGGHKMFQWGVASASTTQVLYLSTSANYRLVDAGNNATNSSGATFGSVSTTDPIVLRMTYNGNLNVWQDGVQIVTNAKVSGIGNKAIGAAPMITIGADGVGGNAWQGWIAEMYVVSTVANSSQGREMDKLLGAKYGIAIT
jgi:hypothetical protein